MAVYTCPVCGDEMPRELIRFLDHTNGHIIDTIKSKHPEWVGKHGICEKCLEYYQKQLSGNS